MYEFVKRFAACTVILAVWAAAGAAEYPERLIRVVVTAPTGGGTDLVARRIGQKLSESWGQPVIIENKGGGGGGVAAQVVARSNASGYTLLLAAGTNMTVGPKLYNWSQNIGIDPVKDFAPVTEIASASYVVVVHPTVQAQTLPQLIALIKQKKENFSFASSAAGTPDHLSGVLFKMMAGVDNLVHIPYAGGGPALIAVRGGQVQMGFVSIPAALPHVQSQGVRGLAITDSKRSQLLPDVPTVAETLPGYEILTWFGIWAPAGTPPAVVDKIHREVKRIVSMPDVNAFLRNEGFEPVASTPAEFAEFSKQETAKYGKIITAGGVRID